MLYRSRTAKMKACWRYGCLIPDSGTPSLLRLLVFEGAHSRRVSFASLIFCIEFLYLMLDIRHSLGFFFKNLFYCCLLRFLCLIPGLFSDYHQYCLAVSLGPHTVVQNLIFATFSFFLMSPFPWRAAYDAYNKSPLNAGQENPKATAFVTSNF